MIASVATLTHIAALTDLQASSDRLTDKVHLAMFAILLVSAVASAIWAAVKRKVIADHQRTQPQPSAPAPSATSATASSAVDGATPAAVG